MNSSRSERFQVGLQIPATHQPQLTTMMVVGDRDTPENADAGGFECEQKRVYGDRQNKDNDRTAGDQDYEARVQRE